MLCHNRFYPPEPQRHHRDISGSFIPHRERRLFGLDRVKLRFALKGTDSFRQYRISDILSYKRRQGV
jgi:hypothetical protein